MCETEATNTAGGDPFTVGCFQKFHQISLISHVFIYTQAVRHTQMLCESVVRQPSFSPSHAYSANSARPTSALKRWKPVGRAVDRAVDRAAAGASIQNDTSG